MDKIINRFLRDLLVAGLLSGGAWAIFATIGHEWKIGVAVSAIFFGLFIGSSVALFNSSKDILNKITNIQDALMAKMPMRPTLKISSFWTFSRESIFNGAVIGLKLSTLYAGIFVVGGILFSRHSQPITSGGELIGTIFILFAVILVGVIPSIIVGAITAVTISTTLWLLKKWLSPFLSTIIAIAICCGFAVLGNYVARSQGIDLTTGRVPFIGIISIFWQGIPVIIYTLTGGYMGWKCFKILTDHKIHVISQVNDDENDGVLS